MTEARPIERESRASVYRAAPDEQRGFEVRKLLRRARFGPQRLEVASKSKGPREEPNRAQNSWSLAAKRSNSEDTPAAAASMAPSEPMRSV